MLSPSAALPDRGDRVWAALHAHPFLSELVHGVLPLEKFRFFIEQDLLYLPDFARCVAMGAAKSESEAELGFFARQMFMRAGRGPGLRRRPGEIFMTSSRLEGALWDMAYALGQWPDLADGPSAGRVAPVPSLPSPALPPAP